MDGSPLTANWISVFGLVVNGVLAIAAFTALWFSQRQSKKSLDQTEKLARQDLEYRSLPLIAPVGPVSLNPGTDGKHGHSDPNGITWDGKPKWIEMVNAGSGTAFNVHFIISHNVNGENDQSVSWNNGPIQGGSSQHFSCEKPMQVRLLTHMSVDGIHGVFGDRSHSVTQLQNAFNKHARLTVTYEDLLGKKHLGIFDYISTYANPTVYKWWRVDTKSNIEYDLAEIFKDISLAKSII